MLGKNHWRALKTDYYNSKRSDIARKRFMIRVVSLLTTLILAGLVLFILLTIVAFAIFTKDLPSPTKLSTRDQSLSTQIFDRNGEKLYDIYGNQNRALVKLSDLPDYMKEATIAIEDKDFYTHKGFAPKGIFRALFDIVVHRRLEGGSTLTQQVVKNTLLTPERTITRKIREFILAIQAERIYSKDEILQMYLNEVPYGGTAWGIEAASQTYFSKKAKDLSLTEAIILAGMPQQPSTYSPYGSNPKAYISRATEVARRMREDEKITKEQEEQVVKELPNVKFSPSGTGIKAPHFVIYIKELLEDQYGSRVVEQGGLKVKTTLDLKIQDEAQRIVAEEISKLKNLQVGNGGVVVTDPKTGEILAMVGSKDYFAKDYDGNVNVTLAKRQPGSSIKPINYASAFQQGYTASYMVMDVQTEFPGGQNQPPYKPVNYDGKYHGPEELRYALGNSFNIPAVKVLALGGIKNMLNVAYKMGLTTLEPTQENLSRFGLSLTLGGGEVKLLDMSTAFGVFATGGYKHDPTGILKVEDSDGKVLQEYKENSGQKVLSPEISFLISNILSDNGARSEAFGTNSYLKIGGKTVAAKTGTTDDKRDNWTIGYTKDYVVGVWVGNNDNSKMNPSLASGITGAAPIWNKVMQFVLKDKKDQPFDVPSGIVRKEVDSVDGGLPCPGHATRQEFFIKGTEPSQSCLIFKNFNGQEYLVFKEDDPVSTDGKNRWQDGINAWIATQSDPKYHPPGDAKFDDGSGSSSPTPTNENEVKVEISKPGNDSKFDTSSGDQKVDVETKIEAQKPIALVEFWVNDNLVFSRSDGPFNFSYYLPKNSTGDYIFLVRAYNSQGNTGESQVKVTAQK